MLVLLRSLYLNTIDTYICDLDSRRLAILSLILIIDAIDVANGSQQDTAVATLTNESTSEKEKLKEGVRSRSRAPAVVGRGKPY